MHISLTQTHSHKKCDSLSWQMLKSDPICNSIQFSIHFSSSGGFYVAQIQALWSILKGILCRKYSKYDGIDVIMLYKYFVRQVIEPNIDGVDIFSGIAWFWGKNLIIFFAFSLEFPSHSTIFFMECIDNKTCISMTKIPFYRNERRQSKRLWPKKTLIIQSDL